MQHCSKQDATLPCVLSKVDGMICHPAFSAARGAMYTSRSKELVICLRRSQMINGDLCPNLGRGFVFCAEMPRQESQLEEPA